VVQFRAGTDIGAGRVEGRVEHILSGRTASFRSVDKLIEAMDVLLKAEAQVNKTLQGVHGRTYETGRH
jgi:hypothetical protein